MRYLVCRSDWLITVTSAICMITAFIMVRSHNLLFLTTFFYQFFLVLNREWRTRNFLTLIPDS